MLPDLSPLQLLSLLRLCGRGTGGSGPDLRRPLCPRGGDHPRLKEGPPDISGYKLIGLASGAYFGTLHEAIAAFAGEAAFTPDHRVFLAATCGAGYKDHTYRVRKLLEERGVACLGRFQCRGYDTYGIFGKIGGIAKGRPNEHDLQMAEQFAQRMAKEAK